MAREHYAESGAEPGSALPPSYMHGLYPIIRRVRRPLIVQDTRPVNAEAKSVNEVSGETPETTRATRVLPEETSHEETTPLGESGPTLGN